MEQQRKNSFASASIFFGILALVSCFFIYPAIFFGSLSILFALLSRQDSLKMPSASSIGLALSAASITLAIILIITALFLLTRMYGVETLFDMDKMEAAYQDLVQRYMELTGGMAQ